MDKEMEVEREDNLRIQVVRAEQGPVVIHISMPANEFDDLTAAIKVEKTRSTMCKAMEETGLDKVLRGSTWCMYCYRDGKWHQFKSKNWASAFFEAVWYCGGSYDLSRGRCSSDHKGVVNHG